MSATKLQEVKRPVGRPRKAACDKCGGLLVASRCPLCRKASQNAWRARNAARFVLYREKATSARATRRAERERAEQELIVGAYESAGRSVRAAAKALRADEKRLRGVLRAAGVDLRWRDHSRRSRVCTAPGCEGRHNAKGFCQKHYWQQPGNLERARFFARRHRAGGGKKSADAARRAREHSAVAAGNVTNTDLSQLVADAGYRCAYCRRAFDQSRRGTSLTFDHVVPLARGGRHEVANLRPACWSCNASKKDRPLAEWGGPTMEARAAVIAGF